MVRRSGLDVCRGLAILAVGCGQNGGSGGLSPQRDDDARGGGFRVHVLRVAGVRGAAADPSAGQPRPRSRPSRRSFRLRGGERFSGRPRRSFFHVLDRCGHGFLLQSSSVPDAARSLAAARRGADRRVPQLLRLRLRPAHGRPPVRRPRRVGRLPVAERSPSGADWDQGTRIARRSARRQSGVPGGRVGLDGRAESLALGPAGTGDADRASG